MGIPFYSWLALRRWDLLIMDNCVYHWNDARLLVANIWQNMKCECGYWPHACSTSQYPPNYNPFSKERSCIAEPVMSRLLVSQNFVDHAMTEMWMWILTAHLQPLSVPPWIPAVLQGAIWHLCRRFLCEAQAGSGEGGACCGLKCRGLPATAWCICLHAAHSFVTVYMLRTVLSQFCHSFVTVSSPFCHRFVTVYMLRTVLSPSCIFMHILELSRSVCMCATY
jgi:hypothetical protein